MSFDRNIFVNIGKSRVNIGYIRDEFVGFINSTELLDVELKKNLHVLFYENRLAHIDAHKDDFISDNEYNKCLEMIPEIINHPDYLSIHPNRKSISFIKDFDSHTNVAVRVNSKGQLSLRTMYSLVDAMLTHYLEKNFAWKIGYDEEDKAYIMCDKNIKAAIFDLDGTLLDTSVGVLSSVKKMIEHFGLHNLTEEELQTFIGPPINKHLEKIYGLSEDKAMEAMNYFREEYPKGDIFKAEHYDKMSEMLATLKRKGIKLGVSTYKREDMAKTLLEEKGLAKHFDVIHGSNAASNLTKADIVDMTIRDLGFSPEETVMIGDSDNDAIGAAGAGALFIGVTYGFGFKNAADVASFENIGIAAIPMDIVDIIG